MFGKILRFPMIRELVRGFTSHYRGSGTVLMYHRVREEKDFCDEFRLNRILTVSVKEFENQMSYLVEKRNPVHMHDFFESLKRGESDPRDTVVTFDDGYLDNFTHALPILEKYSIPATIFITTGFTDKAHEPWWLVLEKILKTSSSESLKFKGKTYSLKDRAIKEQTFNALLSFFKISSDPHALMEELRLSLGDNDLPSEERLFLNENEMQKLISTGLITLMPHTVSHPSLKVVDEGFAKSEMDASRRRISEITGREVKYFAYPFGGTESVSEREFKISCDLGFEFSFTTFEGHIQPEHSELRHCLPRIMVSSEDTLNDFDFKLSGAYAFQRQRGRRIAVI